MNKYVWLDIHTGQFSDSWNEELQNKTLAKDKEYIKEATKEGLKLIKYKCLNDENFELYDMMKLK